MARDDTRYGFPPERPAFEAFPDQVPWDAALADISGWWLEIRCAACGTYTSYPLRLLAANQGWSLTLRGVVPKLKCRACRGSPTEIELIDHPGGDTGRHGARTHRHRVA